MRGMQWQRGMIATASLLMVSAAGAQQVQVSKDNRSILVSAVGAASAEADAATVHIGYQIYGPDSETAYARGSKSSHEITAALTEAGIPKDAIESDTQSIAEAQPYELNHLTPAERADRVFHLQQSWTVKTSAKDAGRVLDIAVKAGANASGQIDWRMADTDALHAKAVEDAMARAKKNAESIATGMEVKLGVLIYASNDRPPRLDGIQQFAMLQGADGRAVEKRIPLAVNPKKIDDTAVIYAVYAIE
jgi:uncharacterized protein YggE